MPTEMSLEKRDLQAGCNVALTTYLSGLPSLSELSVCCAMKGHLPLEHSTK